MEEDKGYDEWIKKATDTSDFSAPKSTPKEIVQAEEVEAPDKLPSELEKLIASLKAIDELDISDEEKKKLRNKIKGSLG